MLNVVYDEHIPAQVAKELHRSRAWASDWLKRYREEDIEGLKNRSKSGRPQDISEEKVRRESRRDKKPTFLEQTGLDYKTGL